MRIDNNTNQKQFIKLHGQPKFNPLTRQSPVSYDIGQDPELRSSGKIEGKMDSSKLQDTKLKKACQDFESIFLFHLLKAMRSTVPKEGFLEDDLGNDIYTSMMDEELAKKMSSGKGIGISDMLYKEFSKFDSKTETDQTEKVTYLDRSFPRKEVKITSDSQGSEKVSRFEDHINLAAEKFDVPAQLIKAVIYQESGGNPKAISSKGAKGLMQLADSTAQQMGVKNVFDPMENILAGTKYLKSLLERFNGDLKLALAAYNAGPSIVEKIGDVPPFKETINYVNKVLKFFQDGIESKYNGGEFASQDK